MGTFRSQDSPGASACGPTMLGMTTVRCGQFLPPAPCSFQMAWGWTSGRRQGGWREGRPGCGRSCSRYSRWPLRRAIVSAPTGALRMDPPVSDLPATAAAGKSPVQDHRQSHALQPGSSECISSLNQLHSRPAGEEPPGTCTPWTRGVVTFQLLVQSAAIEVFPGTHKYPAKRLGQGVLLLHI